MSSHSEDNHVSFQFRNDTEHPHENRIKLQRNSTQRSIDRLEKEIDQYKMKLANEKRKNALLRGLLHGNQVPKKHNGNKKPTSRPIKRATPSVSRIATKKMKSVKIGNKTRVARQIRNNQLSSSSSGSDSQSLKEDIRDIKKRLDIIEELHKQRRTSKKISSARTKVASRKQSAVFRSIQQPHQDVTGEYDEENENWGVLGESNSGEGQKGLKAMVQRETTTSGQQEYSQNSYSQSSQYSSEPSQNSNDNGLITVFEPSIPCTSIRAREKSPYIREGFAFESVQDKAYVELVDNAVKIPFVMILNKKFHPTGTGRRTKLAYVGFQYADLTSLMYVPVRNVVLENFMRKRSRLDAKNGKITDYGTKFVWIRMSKRIQQSICDKAIRLYHMVYGSKVDVTVELEQVPDKNTVRLKASTKLEYCIEARDNGAGMRILDALIAHEGNIQGDALLFMRFSDSTNSRKVFLRFRLFRLQTASLNV